MLVLAKGLAPAWTGAAACWAGWAGVFVEVELGWPGTVVAGESERKRARGSQMFSF